MGYGSTSDYGFLFYKGEGLDNGIKARCFSIFPADSFHYIKQPITLAPSIESSSQQILSNGSVHSDSLKVISP